jgi:AraC-like DNA-binding protein
LILPRLVSHEAGDHLAALAARVSMARTGFAVRFSTMAGVGPLDDWRKWRMQKASDFLRQGEDLCHLSCDRLSRFRLV